MPAHLLLQYQALISAFVVAVIASFIRLMFNRDLTFTRTLCNFFGGVALGLLFGYILRTNAALGIWKDVVVAGISLFGKELTEGIIKIIPNIIGDIPELIKTFLYNWLNKKT